MYQYEPTPLRSSKMYYKLYCVGLNTIVASIFPLMALILLNIGTVKALRKMTFEHRILHQQIELNPIHKKSDPSAQNTPLHGSQTLDKLDNDDEANEPFLTGMGDSLLLQSVLAF